MTRTALAEACTHNTRLVLPVLEHVFNILQNQLDYLVVVINTGSQLLEVRGHVWYQLLVGSREVPIVSLGDRYPLQ